MGTSTFFLLPLFKSSLLSAKTQEDASDLQCLLSAPDCLCPSNSTSVRNKSLQDVQAMVAGDAGVSVTFSVSKSSSETLHIALPRFGVYRASGITVHRSQRHVIHKLLIEPKS